MNLGKMAETSETAKMAQKFKNLKIKQQRNTEVVKNIVKSTIGSAESGYLYFE